MMPSRQGLGLTRRAQLDRKQRNDKMGGQQHRRKASCWTILVGTSLCLLAQVHFLLLLWSGLFIPSTETARSRRVEGRQASIAVADAPTDKTRNATNTVPQGLFPDGKLNVLEPLWPGRCVSFRFRGSEDLFSLKEASQLLRESPAIAERPLRIGIQLAEDATKFFPVRIRESGNVYHMYHFVEFIVMAFAAMATLRGYPAAAASDESWTSATQISVPWLFSPHASRKELCGGPSNINCIIADLVFRSSTSESFQDHSAVIGLDEMDSFTFDAMNPKHKGIEQRINAARTAYEGDSRFARADGMIKIERFGCNNGGINKPWHVFIDSFPATLWHNSIRSGLPATLKHEPSSTRLVACYVDRQNTDRKLPDEHHSWLVETLQSHVSVSFVQLHMEEYSALEQIQIASRCDLMVGMHGNGLTHSLWMKPGGYIIEFFWKYNFQYDYATAAQLLKHQYLGIFNGRVLNETLVRQRDPSLRISPTRREAQREPVNQSMANFEEFGKPAIVQRLNDAIEHKLGGGHREESGRTT